MPDKVAGSGWGKRWKGGRGLQNMGALVIVDDSGGGLGVDILYA